MWGTYIHFIPIYILPSVLYKLNARVLPNFSKKRLLMRFDIFKADRAKQN